MPHLDFQTIPHTGQCSVSLLNTAMTIQSKRTVELAVLPSTDKPFMMPTGLLEMPLPGQNFMSGLDVGPHYP